MSKPYTPKPGTIPARVIAHLETLPPGTFVSTAVLGKLLDIPLLSLSTTLEVLLLQGVVVERRSKVGSRPVEWALCDCKLLPFPDERFRAGVFTDGSLRIEHGDIVITLNPTQAAEVARLTNQSLHP